MRVLVRLKCVYLCLCVRLVALRLPAGKTSSSFSQSSAHFPTACPRTQTHTHSHTHTRCFPRSLGRQQPVDFSVPACAACLFISHTFVCTLKFPLFCPSRGCPCCCCSVYPRQFDLASIDGELVSQRSSQAANFQWRS